jgi:phosphoribosylglycinamide formyltransferase-1
MSNKRIVVLISGRGSNLQALIESCAVGTLRAENVEIASVISNRADAGGLDLAARAGIPTRTLSHKDFATREAFDDALRTIVLESQPDLVVLAGFMRVLTPVFVEAFPGRLINIHPSLLPAFTGLDTHARAIAAGCKFAGCTVHFVTSELDHGPIIAQAVVPILPDDDEAALAARVLVHEHRLLPQAVADFCGHRLVVEGNRVSVNAGYEFSR